MSNDTIRSHWLLAPACASDASLPVPLGDVTALLEPPTGTVRRV